MRKIEPSLYLLEVELPKSPLKSVNCYFILGHKRHLLIDTAFNHETCELSILAQLGELGVTIEDTDIFVTHLHVDHSGLIARLKRPTNEIYASPQDKALIDGFQQPQRWGWVADNNELMGIPESYKLRIEDHVAYRMRPDKIVDITTVSEGHKLSIGGFELEVIDLPGHTPGHIGLWESNRGYLFCGDHILSDISTNTTAWDLDNDYLTMYRESLLKVRGMPTQKLFTAHRNPPKDTNARIDELLDHQHLRSRRVLEILGASPTAMSVFEMALQMEWSIPVPLLEAHPQQLWFACSETLAHLQSLWRSSQVTRSSQHGILYYSL